MDSPATTPISAVIITLNEERNIGRCLASIQPVVDEIIVIDSCSTDRTAAICEEYEVRFIKRKWAGYAQTKNFANGLANHQYVLSIDADEALSPALQLEIEKAKGKGLEGIYSFNRLTNYCGHWVRHGGWYPDVKARLFPKSVANWEGNYVHEEIQFSGNPTKQHLQGDLLHYSIYSVKDHLDRVEKYTDLGAQKMLAAGKKGGRISGVLSAFSRFVRMYFLKLGFLDGWAGWKISTISAKASYLRYRKLEHLRANG
ncbi:MAG: glycosyltransferase family 2 protein [Salibacteraceae bacterium]